MLNRSADKSTAAVKELKEEFGAGADVSFVRMDLAELASVRAAVEVVLKTVPEIDALICNAAIAQVPTQKLTVDGFESQLGTNHYGHFVLCGMLFDRIEESKGRIVVVASLGYKLGIRTIQFDDMNWDKNYSANPVYSQSKLAQMMFAYELQDRVKAANKNVEVFVCHPGSSATSLISTSGGLMTRIAWWLMTKSPMVQTAEKGAIGPFALVLDGHMRLDALIFHQPTDHLGSPIGAVTGKAFRIEAKPIHDPLDHRPCRTDLGLADGSRRLDIDDDGIVGVDQIVGGIGEKSWATQSARPLGCRI